MYPSSQMTDLFTVFAPTASAFLAIQDTVDGLLLPENKAQLAEVLKFNDFRRMVRAGQPVARCAEPYEPPEPPDHCCLSAWCF